MSAIRGGRMWACAVSAFPMKFGFSAINFLCLVGEDRVNVNDDDDMRV